MALDTFGRLEVMGHLTFVGKLSEEEIAGTLMVRVDFTQAGEAKVRFFGASSIYSIEPLSEQEVIEYRERQAAPRRIAHGHWEGDYDPADDDDDEDQGL